MSEITGFKAPPAFPSEIDARDPRMGHILGSGLDREETPVAAIIGFPSDTGVIRNGGRPGAASGPAAIREILYKLTPDSRLGSAFESLVRKTSDHGDLVLAGDLEADQKTLGHVVGVLLQNGTFPIVLGGGHEAAFGHFLGYVEAGLTVEIVNIDAHTDVRPLNDGFGHSGSPFRQALEHGSGLCRSYKVAGLQPHAVSGSHIDFIREWKGCCVYRDECSFDTIHALFGKEKAGERIMATFDLDAVDQAHAPGVSAPALNGLDPEYWLNAALEAGSCPRVSSFEIVELNPLFDRDHQTARLAAVTVWNFLAGLARRKSDKL